VFRVRAESPCREVCAASYLLTAPTLFYQNVFPGRHPLAPASLSLYLYHTASLTAPGYPSLSDGRTASCCLTESPTVLYMRICRILRVRSRVFPPCLHRVQIHLSVF